MFLLFFFYKKDAWFMTSVVFTYLNNSVISNDYMTSKKQLEKPLRCGKQCL